MSYADGVVTCDCFYSIFRKAISPNHLEIVGKKNRNFEEHARIVGLRIVVNSLTRAVCGVAMFRSKWADAFLAHSICENSNTIALCDCVIRETKSRMPPALTNALGNQPTADIDLVTAMEFQDEFATLVGTAEKTCRAKKL